MVSEHDRELVTRITAGDVRGVLGADDPAAVLAAVGSVDGTVAVDVGDLPGAIAVARVRLAEVVVARARRAEDAALTTLTPPTSSAVGDLGPEDGCDDDRHAVRFSLAILVPALAGGIAVYLANGLLLAPALPAVALAAVGIVVGTNRRPATPVPGEGPVPTDPAPATAAVRDGPAVRAAEAHLRRQHATWKLVWWEREEPVPDLASWSPRLAATAPITLVSVDAAGRLDAEAYAEVTATAPVAVRLVVLQARG